MTFAAIAHVSAQVRSCEGCTAAPDTITLTTWSKLSRPAHQNAANERQIKSRTPTAGADSDISITVAKRAIYVLIILIWNEKDR